MKSSLRTRRGLTTSLALASAVAASALLAGCHHLQPPKPLDQLTPEEAQGRVVFDQHCAQCHFDRQPGPLHGPSLLGVFQKPYLPSGAPANDDRVTATVEYGRTLMPPQPLSKPEIQALLAYLHTL